MGVAMVKRAIPEHSYIRVRIFPLFSSGLLGERVLTAAVVAAISHIHEIGTGRVGARWRWEHVVMLHVL
jgi:hypothetical protein